MLMTGKWGKFRNSYLTVTGITSQSFKIHIPTIAVQRASVKSELEGRSLYGKKNLIDHLKLSGQETEGSFLDVYNYL